MTALSRRSLLRYGLAGTGGLAAASLFGPASAHAAPGLVRGTRPRLTHGLQLGDPRRDGAVVWTRADAPSRMWVDVALRPDFRGAERVRGPVLGPDADGTGRVRLRGLPPGRTVHVRVTAEDLEGRVASEPLTGTFRTPGRGNVRFLWSGDVAGQGFGINPDIGGMRVFSAMAARDPDFFVHSGDSVYADNPIAETVTLPDGRVWRNVVTPAKSKVAETLTEFRGNFAYNLIDDNLRAFAARVPMIAQWDDHEVLNNWYPGEVIDDERYTERRVDVLAGRAFQAFHEWMPILPREAVDGRVYRNVSLGPYVDVFVLDMRTYRDANSAGTAPFERILGEAQARWLVDALARSRATWKIVASDMPIGMVVPDGDLIEGVANRLPGEPLAREAEIAWVLGELYRREVHDIVWITTDVHHTAANHYAPERAAFRDFRPFWEFVSGPLNAGAFGPVALDSTFGPETRFSRVPPRAGASPLEGFQNFGEVNVDAETRELRVDLRDSAGGSLWSITLSPHGR